MHHRLALPIASCLLLAACGSSGPADQTGTSQPAASATSASTPAPPATGMKRFSSAQAGFYIDYPQTLASSNHFDSKYLANSDWKAYAPLGSVGTPVLMLTLPGSNDVTAGELRIGVSRQPDEVQKCNKLSGAADSSTLGKTDINGIAFTTWHAHDAAMSHYLKVHSYRSVHDGTCYAIDLLVTGTNPAVYSPPRTPPFSQNEAFAKLNKTLRGFHFAH